MRTKDYSDDETTYLDIEKVVRETDQAKLFEIDGNKVWVPKSLIIVEDDDTLGIPTWWARKQGLD